MLTPRHQLADMLTKGIFPCDEWNRLLRLFNIMSFSMYFCSFSVRHSKTEHHVEVEDAGRKIGEEERVVAKPKSIMIVSVERLPISLQQHCASRSPGHSKQTIRIQTVPVRENPLRKVCMKTHHRILTCGIRMQTRSPVRGDSCLKRQRKPPVQSYLTTTMRNPGTMLAMLKTAYSIVRQKLSRLRGDDMPDIDINAMICYFWKWAICRTSWKRLQSE